MNVNGLIEKASNQRLAVEQLLDRLDEEPVVKVVDEDHDDELEQSARGEEQKAIETILRFQPAKRASKNTASLKVDTSAAGASSGGTRGTVREEKYEDYNMLLEKYNHALKEREKSSSRAVKSPPGRMTTTRSGKLSPRVGGRGIKSPRSAKTIRDRYKDIENSFMPEYLSLLKEFHELKANLS